MNFIKPLIIFTICLTVIQEIVALNYNVHLFYYPWYGSPSGPNKAWRHWDNNGNKVNPPDDITSNYYPVLGPYDSCDTKALDQHMTWISQSGAGTIMTSWWGQGSYEDKCITAIMDAANKQKIKVGFHIEPYTGRTAAKVVSDVNYINEKYGKHAAYYKDTAHSNKPWFYIYYSLELSDWSALDSVNKNNILLAQTTDQSKLPHFGGFYNYAVNGNPKVADFKGMYDFCVTKSCVWSPSIGPGYNDRRAVPASKATLWDRKNGDTYDINWSAAINSGSVYVSVTSFNEWHEGSQIEPASSTPPSGVTYSTFVGSYNKTGTAAQNSYIERTKYWVDQFTSKHGG